MKGDCTKCGGVGELTTTEGARSKILGRVVVCDRCLGTGREPVPEDGESQ